MSKFEKNSTPLDLRTSTKKKEVSSRGQKKANDGVAQKAVQEAVQEVVQDAVQDVVQAVVQDAVQKGVQDVVQDAAQEDSRADSQEVKVEAKEDDAEAKKGVKTEYQKKVDKYRKKMKEVGEKFKGVVYELDPDWLSDEDQSSYEGYSDGGMPRYTRYGPRQGYRGSGRSTYGFGFRLSRWEDILLYISFIDERIKMLQELNDRKDGIKSHQEKLISTFGGIHHEAWSRPYEIRGLLQSVINAYQAVRRKLVTKKSNNGTEYDNLLAALEIVGSLILDPEILELRYKGYVRPFHIGTRYFISAWAHQRIERVSWMDDAPGLRFHLVERSTIEHVFSQSKNEVAK